MSARQVFPFILAIVFLSSCASLHRYTLQPANGTYPFEWDAKTDSAVVFVGIYGDQPISYLDVNGSDLNAYGYLQRPYDLSAIAVHVKVGGEFQVTRASLGFTGPRSALAEGFFRFPDLPSVPIDRPGSYVYGTIVVQGEEAFFTTENIKDLVAAARRDHPTVFERLESVNF